VEGVCEDDGEMNTQEITLKRWTMDEAEREGCAIATIERRFQRGWYNATLNVRRVNKRVVYVQVRED